MTIQLTYSTTRALHVKRFHNAPRAAVYAARLRNHGATVQAEQLKADGTRKELRI